MPENKHRRNRSYAEMHVLSDSMACAVLLLDHNFALRFANPRACALLGCGTEEELKRSWLDLLPQLSLDRVLDLEKGAQPMQTKWEIALPNSRKSLRAEVHVVEDEAENGFILLIKDCRTLTAVDEQLLAAGHGQALAFLSSGLVHSLNGPPNNMQIAVSLLETIVQKAQPDDLSWRERALRYITLLKDEIGRMAEQIHRLPEQFARPRLSPREDFDLRKVVEEIGRLIRHESTARQIRRTVTVADDALLINGNRESVSLALLCSVIALLDGAGRGSSVFIDAYRVDGSAEVSLRVEAGALQNALFDGFERLSYSSSGGDVGLFAARLIVEAHGGDFASSTDPDCPFGFRISFPLKEAHTQD